MRQKITQGFTLLEMSIVILIIALLAAGVVSGKALIRQAELRAIVQEYDRHTKSIKEFLDKYRALPGDMNTATGLWGTYGTCPSTTYITTVPTSTSTCNGNGDGKISSCTGALSCSAPTESFAAWQHLANAGLAEGRYTGAPGSNAASSPSHATPGLNVPKSRFIPGGWSIVYYLNPTTGAYLVGDHYGHVLLFGGGKGNLNGLYTTQPILPVSDTFEMDRKMDDGLPTTGILRAWDDYWMPNSDNGPTNNAGGSVAEYCVNSTAYYVPDGTYSEKQQLCSLVFIPGF